MISILSHNKLNEQKNNLYITYPRTVNIIFGHYDYPDIINNLIIDIKNNLDSKMENYTNVKGGMTSWYHFNDNKLFNNFIVYVINQHQISNPDLFQYFLEKFTINASWGNEIKNGDELKYHFHDCYHGILYLTEGCDLKFPELNIKINPKPGDYYIFPPQILHGFDKYIGEKNRYSLVFNIEEKKNKFDFTKKINGKNS
jgi:hypothetical protein